jgi:hypothetical protein
VRIPVEPPLREDLGRAATIPPPVLRRSTRWPVDPRPPRVDLPMARVDSPPTCRFCLDPSLIRVVDPLRFNSGSAPSAPLRSTSGPSARLQAGPAAKVQAGPSVRHGEPTTHRP